MQKLLNFLLKKQLTHSFYYLIYETEVLYEKKFNFNIYDGFNALGNKLYCNAKME